MALALNNAIETHVLTFNNNEPVHGIKVGDTVHVDEGFTVLTTDIDTGEVMQNLCVNYDKKLYKRISHCVEQHGVIKNLDALNLKRVVVKVKLIAEVIEVYEDGQVMSDIVKGVKEIYYRERN